MQKSLKNKKILIVLSFAVLLFLIACFETDDSRKANISYGDSLFLNRCLQCHGYRDDYQGAPSVKTMRGLDSIVLIKVLEELPASDKHKLEVPTPYAITEVYSLYMFIKDEDQVVP